MIEPIHARQRLYFTLGSTQLDGLDVDRGDVDRVDVDRVDVDRGGVGGVTFERSPRSQPQ